MVQGDMDVRSATEEDIDQLIRVAKHAWRVDYAEDILTSETVDEAVNDWYAPDRIAAELDAERTTLLVAVRDEEVVGFAHGTWSDETGDGYVLRLYVDPEHRRAGAGETLLRETCRVLAAHDAQRVNAMVLSANEPGIGFYEQFGFEFVDEQETTIGSETLSESRYAVEVDSVLSEREATGS